MGMFDFLGDLGGGFTDGLSKVPFIGGMFESDAEKQAQARFGAVADRYRQLKPEVAQSYNNAMNQQLGAFQPANAMLGNMAGGDPSMMINMQALGQQPATPGMVAGAPSTDIQGASDTFMGGFVEQPFAGPFGPLEHLGKQF